MFPEGAFKEPKPVAREEASSSLYRSSTEQYQATQAILNGLTSWKEVVMTSALINSMPCSTRSLRSRGLRRTPEYYTRNNNYTNHETK
ncbi:hypothetical protein SARC_04309 [Sphaeroforma arctica JP610]|uniref:Uncharacterized protein n=1 Tax=Sphaeroforma arctica JP610 TaxID=667725 RepID=A0A0L0G3K1_9EUKA|nr:hypothetical protein SARC_04309 [Sphaeroforma arctica JP610]KNC83444.1 hypothetical protein SARC_04309 [Sphaeroforma arctica JP610]|eukprot:XP_014157346.1 hypothetical protein SARC_04309 [Sphaeroforma arctica JP610]